MRKLWALPLLLLLSGMVMGQTSPNPITRYCQLTATGYCPGTAGVITLNQGIDTHNVYIVPIGTPGSISVSIQGSVIGDFTDVVTCGSASTTTTPNLLSCSGIYSAVRVKVTTLAGFTSVNLFYVGTSTVGHNGGSGGGGNASYTGTLNTVPMGTGSHALGDAKVSQVLSATMHVVGTGLNDATISQDGSPLPATQPMYAAVCATNVFTNGIATATIAAAGTGYVVADDPQPDLALGDGGAYFLITGVDGSGAVTSFAVYTDYPGNNYSVASNVATTGGSGAGFRVNITAVANMDTADTDITQANAAACGFPAQVVAGVPICIAISPASEYTCLLNDPADAGSFIPGAFVTFAASTGHTAGDVWTATDTITPVQVVKNSDGSNGLSIGNAGTWLASSPLYIHGASANQGGVEFINDTNTGCTSNAIGVDGVLANFKICGPDATYSNAHGNYPNTVVLSSNNTPFYLWPGIATAPVIIVTSETPGLESYRADVDGTNIFTFGTASSGLPVSGTNQLGDLICFVADNMVGRCATTTTPVLGVLENNNITLKYSDLNAAGFGDLAGQAVWMWKGGNEYQSDHSKPPTTGLLVNFSASAAVTVGDFVCQDAVTPYLATDTGTTPCTTKQIGVIPATNAVAATQHNVWVTM